MGNYFLKLVLLSTDRSAHHQNPISWIGKWIMLWYRQLIETTKITF